MTRVLFVMLGLTASGLWGHTFTAPMLAQASESSVRASKITFELAKISAAGLIGS
jgi:hypothetical protein